MDGSYGNNKNFQFLTFKSIQPAIKVRKNSRCRKTNQYQKNNTVNMQKTNLQDWKDSVDITRDGWWKLSFHASKECLENMLLLSGLRI